MRRTAHLYKEGDDMKASITFKEKGKSDVIKEKVIRDLEHLEAQKKYPRRVQRDKTKIIPRKQKYKN